MPCLSMNCTKTFVNRRYYSVFAAKSAEITGIYTVLADKYASEHSANTHISIKTDF